MRCWPWLRQHGAARIPRAASNNYGGNSKGGGLLPPIVAVPVPTGGTGTSTTKPTPARGPSPRAGPDPAMAVGFPARLGRGLSEPRQAGRSPRHFGGVRWGQGGRPHHVEEGQDHVAVPVPGLRTLYSSRPAACLAISKADLMHQRLSATRTRVGTSQVWRRKARRFSGCAQVCRNSRQRTLSASAASAGAKHCQSDRNVSNRPRPAQIRVRRHGQELVGSDGGRACGSRSRRSAFCCSGRE